MRSSRRLTPSFVLSLVALFVALGGTGYAAVAINGKSITPHSIPGNRLKADALTGAQVKESTLGVVPFADHAHGADHAAGADVAQHAALADRAQDATTLGGRAPSAFASSRIRVYWADSPPVDQGVAGVSDVHCGRDEHAVSGGGEWHTINSGVATPTIADDAFIAQSIPEGLTDNGADTHPSGWLVRGHFGGGGQRILRAYVICASDIA
jgi:hypothetical protein